MAATITLYTTALDELETLNINQIEVTHTAEIGNNSTTPRSEQTFHTTSKQ